MFNPSIKRYIFCITFVLNMTLFFNVSQASGQDDQNTQVSGKDSMELVVNDFNKAKMDSLFDLIREKDNAFGTLSVFKEGVEIYTNSVGY